VSNWDLPEHVPVVAVQDVTPELRDTPMPSGQFIPDEVRRVITWTDGYGTSVLSTDLDCPDIGAAAAVWAEACGAAYAGMAVR
jgi:hypothetical protein